jgi:hypothetical protein
MRGIRNAPMSEGIGRQQVTELVMNRWFGRRRHGQHRGTQNQREPSRRERRQPVARQFFQSFFGGR